MGGTVVLWCHMNAEALQWERRPRWFRSLFAATMQQAALCVTVGRKLQSAFPAPLAGLPFAHVHNAVEAPAAAAQHERGPELTVLYLSNMGRQKGWHVLFEAAQQLCARHPDLRFVFVGAPMGDTDDEQLRAAFAASPYAPRIEYRGPLYGAEKDAAFARADIFCFPSLIEAFPLTVLEAMAAGLPVVASDVGAVSEALLPEGGTLVTPGDVEQLRDALDALVANPELRRSMGNFNRERHREHFTPEAFGLAWENIFASLRGSR
jgi:glycosyltransferase involved in cell wall biosynthesis